MYIYYVNKYIGINNLQLYEYKKRLFLIMTYRLGRWANTKVSRSDELIFHTDASVFRYHLLLSCYSHLFFRTYYFIYFVCTKQHLVIAIYNIGCATDYISFVRLIILYLMCLTYIN